MSKVVSVLILFTLLSQPLFGKSHESVEPEQEPISHSKIKEIIDYALNSRVLGFLPFERKALETSRDAADKAEKSKSIFSRAKKKAVNIKDMAKEKTMPIYNRAMSVKEKIYKNFPVNRVARDATIVSVMGLKGCVVGIIAGTPINLALLVETGGLAPAIISASSCAIGATIAASPSFFKAVFSGVSDLYKAHKLRKEIAINQEDLDKLRISLQEATGQNMDTMTSEERGSHLEKVLELNRHVTSVELYIKQMRDTIDSMKG
jgi:hypothetical protein